MLVAGFLLVASPGVAEDAQKPQPLLTIPAGTTVEFRFDEKVKARKSSPGQKVPASVVLDVVVQGTTVIRAGADVTAVVTDSRRKKAGFFRTAEGYVELTPVSVVAIDGSIVSIESVTEIASGTKDKKFTWSAHNANLKAGDSFLAKVTADTAIKRP
jgi:hypothetical protein